MKMTKQFIMDIINWVNPNRDIKWSILKNTAKEIILTNSYDKCVKYTISINHQGADEWISVRDNHMDRLVGCFLQGDDNCSDYTYIDHGIKLAIEEAVENFNETY